MYQTHVDTPLVATASGRIGHVDPTITAFNVVSIILGWYRWFRASGPVTQVDAFEYTVEFAMAAVLNVRAGATYG